MSKQFQENHRSTLVLSTATVPEISWSVSILARSMTKAGAPHVAAVALSKENRFRNRSKHIGSSMVLGL